ncbi:MAG: Gfo/Idh/MocA family oxidoreductase [Planctomycetaceae bacterium]|nr:Gfo/Idh/MocA family oxidoreductase [Planctomycetaceae bacterium]
MNVSGSRRDFFRNVGLGSLGAVAAGSVMAAAPGTENTMLGESGAKSATKPKGLWKPMSDRKIRVGIVGNGACKFGPSFGFQDHPNVTVAAVSDLFPDRCSEMAKVCRCEKTYPSLEEMVKDDTIEAVFVATDAPSHARHCIEVLKHGKHVATAVPAAWGSIEAAHELYEMVKASGKKYMMFETSAFREDCYAMRQIYRAGGFGKLVYTEGEYLHYLPNVFPSYKGWRAGAPQQWYPTHANAYYICVTESSFTEVECMGTPSVIKQFQAGNNQYKNPFGTEVALLRTAEGGTARMIVSYDTRTPGTESGRVYGQRGVMAGTAYSGLEKSLPNLERPPLPPTVGAGHHGGSAGYLMNEFVTAILEDRKPMVDIALAFRMVVPGIVAHQSALKGGELMKVPQIA